MSLNGMDLALAMVSSRNVRQLGERGCQALRNAHALTWVSCLELDANGRQLWIDDEETPLACDDFSHPYAHAIHRGAPIRLTLGDARSRLDHPAFQAQVATLPGHLQLEIRPLRAADGAREWLGVLALAGSGGILDNLLGDNGFAAFETLLCQLWVGRTRQLDERRDKARLRASLDTLNDGARRRSLSERLADDLLGHSSCMTALREQIVRAAETSLSVLLQGETGSGKDRVARALHRLSSRAKGPFIALNCAAIPETLLESELFGHVRGAFSGADQSRQGLLGEANGGTLFLDEIGDMPLTLQAKLLRVLESGRYRPLGDSEERRADLRLVAATHQPLHERIREGRFRADLYYRLGQFPLTLPPLRERRDDIPQLAAAFVDDFCRREKRQELGLTPAALRLLRERDYPGNVRELRNIVDYACAVTPPGRDIEPSCLLDIAPVRQASGDPEETPHDARERPVSRNISDLRQALRDYEAHIISDCLSRYGGNRALAAKHLGLPKRTLAYKCQQLELAGK
ncbi:sigma-54 interaction domain-containing protein [Modicisalibacter xianhensis]|uniref:Sigma-54 specific transcriptional regulator n=1 Tax=Modicisalibacter xianhensis TaxID=442341 RepID=A0A1I3FCN9_9GAMM|nr:sigma 54-interacting transcriptional regulator [Halomonas xianhensis]SFI08957.1 sigma-54 specific transcriptional regulator [Halomonas xianhensis]